MILVGIIFCVAIVSYQYFHSVQIKYLSVTTFKACVDAGFKVFSYPIISYWLDIGKPEDLLKAREDIKHLQI